MSDFVSKKHPRYVYSIFLDRPCFYDMVIICIITRSYSSSNRGSIKIPRAYSLKKSLAERM